jgi:predicted N-acetyltransferase YhbS
MVDQKKISNIHISVNPLVKGDIPQLEPILRQHIKDRYTEDVDEEEVRSIIEYMRGNAEESRGGNARRYLVAKNQEGRVIGCVSCSEPEQDMLEHFGVSIDEAAEGLNLFVDNTFSNQNVGTELVENMFNAARTEGKKYVIVNSGPRYMKAWSFHDKMFDERRGFMVGKYGSGGDAMTWIKTL